MIKVAGNNYAEVAENLIKLAAKVTAIEEAGSKSLFLNDTSDISSVESQIGKDIGRTGGLIGINDEQCQTINEMWVKTPATWKQQGERYNFGQGLPTGQIFADKLFDYLGAALRQKDDDVSSEETMAMAKKNRVLFTYMDDENKLCGLALSYNATDPAIWVLSIIHDTNNIDIAKRNTAVFVSAKFALALSGATEGRSTDKLPQQTSSDSPQHLLSNAINSTTITNLLEGLINRDNVVNRTIASTLPNDERPGSYTSTKIEELQSTQPIVWARFRDSEESKKTAPARIDASEKISTANEVASLIWDENGSLISNFVDAAINSPASQKIEDNAELFGKKEFSSGELELMKEYALNTISFDTSPNEKNEPGLKIYVDDKKKDFIWFPNEPRGKKEKADDPKFVGFILQNDLAQLRTKKSKTKIYDALGELLKSSAITHQFIQGVFESNSALDLIYRTTFNPMLEFGYACTDYIQKEMSRGVEQEQSKNNLVKLITENKQQICLLALSNPGATKDDFLVLLKTATPGFWARHKSTIIEAGAATLGLSTLIGATLGMALAGPIGLLIGAALGATAGIVLTALATGISYIIGRITATAVKPQQEALAPSTADSSPSFSRNPSAEVVTAVASVMNAKDKVIYLADQATQTAVTTSSSTLSTEEGKKRQETSSELLHLKPGEQLRFEQVQNSATEGRVAESMSE